MSNKLKYKVCNWNEYNQSLIARGSLSLWIDEKVLSEWLCTNQTTTGQFTQIYSDACIECGIRLKALYGLPWRAVQGLLQSIMAMLEIDLPVPNYSTFCRRQQSLIAVLEKEASQKNMVLAIDSTGLKVFGEGEWKVRMHGYNFRRVWRKLHLAIDVKTQQIEAVAFSTNDFKDGELLDDLLEQIETSVDKVVADGGYESFDNFESIKAIGAEPVIPPRSDARIKQHGNSAKPRLVRDEVVRARNKTTSKQWKKKTGYHIRSLVETAMYRFQCFFGSTLSAHKFESQLTEVIVKCSMMNKLTSLGMPVSKMS